MEDAIKMNEEKAEKGPAKGKKKAAPKKKAPTRKAAAKKAPAKTSGKA